MAEVVIYSTGTCPRCDRSKALMKKWGIGYDEKRVDQDHAALKEMLIVSNGARTVPQIVVKGKWIGGLDELTEAKMDGDLDELMTGD